MFSNESDWPVLFTDKDREVAIISQHAGRLYGCRWTALLAKMLQDGVDGAWRQVIFLGEKQHDVGLLVSLLDHALVVLIHGDMLPIADFNTRLLQLLK